MITETTIYWLTRLDSIRSLLLSFAFLSGVSCFFTFIFGVVPKVKGGSCLFISVIFIFIASLFGLTFIPTTAEMACIKVIPAAINSKQSEVIKQDFPELYSLTKTYIKNTLQEKDNK